MVASVTEALSNMISWIGEFVTSLVTGGNEPGALNSLLPLFCIGLAASLCMFAMKISLDSQGHMGELI